MNYKSFLIKYAEIGVKGKFESPLSIDQIISKLFVDNQKPFVVLPFGKKEISTVGIISGAILMKIVLDLKLKKAKATAK